MSGREIAVRSRAFFSLRFLHVVWGFKSAGKLSAPKNLRVRERLSINFRGDTWKLPPMDNPELMARMGSVVQQQMPTIGMRDEPAERMLQQTYISPPPAGGLASFGGVSAPYGHDQTWTPETYLSTVPVSQHKQPIYHVKIQAIPAKVEPNEPVQYSVSHVTGDNEIRTTNVTGQVVTHALPHQHGGVIHISPEALGHDRAMSVPEIPIPDRQYLVPGAGPDGLPLTPSSALRSHRGPVVANVPEIGPAAVPMHYPQDEAYPLAPQFSDTTVPVRHHPGFFACCGPPVTGPSEEPKHPEVGLDRRFSRAISMSAPPEGDEVPHVYNWIGPMEDGSAPHSAADMQVAMEGQGNWLCCGARPKSEQQMDVNFALGDISLNRQEKIFEAQHAYDDGDNYDDALSTEDEDLGPAVVYAGVEHCAPEFSGRQTPIHYKLHAIECHQWIEVPENERPWFMDRKLNPHANAIFGPIPLPFDPKFSGMVAPAFTTVVDGSPMPQLSPELAQAFNQELPVIADNEQLRHDECLEEAARARDFYGDEEAYRQASVASLPVSARLPGLP